MKDEPTLFRMLRTRFGYSDGFLITDDRDDPCFTVTLEGSGALRYGLWDRDNCRRSLIRYNHLLMPYFTLRCDGRFYVLLPILRPECSFAVYGSSYRFAGNAAEGVFAMMGENDRPVMTQQRILCVGAQREGYELKIFESDHLIFLLSAAVCADVFLSLSAPEEPFSGRVSPEP